MKLSGAGCLKARLQSWPLVMKIAVGSLIVGILVILMAASMLFRSYLTYNAQAEATTRNLSEVLNKTVGAVISKSELELYDIVEEVAQQSASGGIDPVSLNAYMDRQKTRVPDVDSLRATDARGIVRYGSGISNMPAVDLSDRDFFIAARDNPETKLFIAKPVHARISKKWVLPLAMRLSTRDGAFAGVAYVNISIEAIGRTLSALDVGRHGAIVLLDSRLSIVALVPAPAEYGGVIGTTYASAPLHPLIQAGQRAGTYTARSSVDGILRVFSYQQVDGYPLYVVVGLAREDFLSGWRSEACAAAGLIGIFLVLEFLAAALLYRSWGSRERTARALEESERRMSETILYIRTLLQALPIGIATYKTTGEAVSANEAAARMAGTTVDVLTHLNFREIESWRNFGLLEMAEQVLAFGGEQRADRHMLTTYGKQIDIDCLFAPFQYGGERHLLFAAIDISQRKQAERALRESRERLDLVIRGTGIGLWDWNVQTGEVVINERWAEIVGYTPAELSPINIGTWTGLCHPDDLKLSNDLLQRHFQGETEAYECDCRMRHKDGRWVWVFDRGKVVEWTEDGKPLRMAGTHADITARKVMEEALRESEERFRHLFEKVHVVALVLDPDDGSILDANAAAAAFYGWSRDRLRGMKISEINTLTAGEIQREMEAARDEKQGHFLFRHRLADGSVRDVEVYSGPIQTGGRTVLFSVVHDITERRQAEAKVRQLVSEQRLILETLTVGVGYIRDRRVVWGNGALSRMFGYGQQELIGLGTEMFYDDPSDYERIGLEAYHRLSQGKFYSDELRFRRKGGALFWCRVVGQAVDPDDPKAGSIWMFQDITESKQAELALRKSEGMLQAIIDAEPECVKLLDADANLLMMNHAGLGMIEAESLDQVKGNCLCPMVSSPYREAFMELTKRVFLGESGRLVFEMVGLRGRHLWLETHAVPFRDEKNEIVALLGVTRDITERRAAAEALQEKTRQLEDLTKNLEQRVQEEVALRTKSEQILVQQSKLAAMGEMLGAIAHQWRQPLNALGLIVQNLRDAHSFGELDRTYIESTVEKSMAQIRHMSKTIDDFRNFFQPDKDQTAFDAMQAVGEVMSLLAAQLAANEIYFRLTCHAHGKTFTRVEDIVVCPDKTVRGFRNEFEHVIMNLVNNARWAILERREAGLMDRELKGLIDFVFRRGDDKMIIEVSDNGGGIDPEVIGRVFEPYFTTRDHSKGTGLGLYMSKVMVEDHMRGTITAHNGKDGAVFTITLPGV